MNDMHYYDDNFVDLFSESYRYQTWDRYLVLNSGVATRPVNVYVVTLNVSYYHEIYYTYEWKTINPGQDRVFLGTYYALGWTDLDDDHTWDDFEAYGSSISIDPNMIQCPPIPSVVSTSICLQNPNYPLYQNKHRVWNDFIDFSAYSNCILANPAPLPTEAERLNQYRTLALADLENLKLRWADQLKAVRTEEGAFNGITDATIDDLVNALVEVAKVNIQRANTREEIRAASNYAGSAPGGVYLSFKAAFLAKIGATLVQQGFSQDLLERPYPYNRTPVDANSNSGEINSTICANLSALKNRYNTSGFGGSFYDYLKQELEEDMMLTSTQLQDLENKCASNCRYLNEPVLLPVALATPVPQNQDHPFVNCSRVNTLRSDFLNEYPGIDQNSKLFRVLFTNYCNHALGYALSYSDYIAFSEKCVGTNTAVLYNKPASPSVKLNDFLCAENSIMTAYERAGQSTTGTLRWNGKGSGTCTLPNA